MKISQDAETIAQTANVIIQRLSDENLQYRRCIDWIESWISNPVGAYSVSALDGLFDMTRDKIAALQVRYLQEIGK